MPPWTHTLLSLQTQWSMANNHLNDKKAIGRQMTTPWISAFVKLRPVSWNIRLHPLAAPWCFPVMLVLCEVSGCLGLNSIRGSCVHLGDKEGVDVGPNPICLRTRKWVQDSLWPESRHKKTRIKAIHWLNCRLGLTRLEIDGFNTKDTWCSRTRVSLFFSSCSSISTRTVHTLWHVNERPSPLSASCHYRNHYTQK